MQQTLSSPVPDMAHYKQIQQALDPFVRDLIRHSDLVRAQYKKIPAIVCSKVVQILNEQSSQKSTVSAIKIPEEEQVSQPSKEGKSENALEINESSKAMIESTTQQTQSQTVQDLQFDHNIDTSMFLPPMPEWTMIEQNWQNVLNSTLVPANSWEQTGFMPTGNAALLTPPSTTDFSLDYGSVNSDPQCNSTRRETPPVGDMSQQNVTIPIPASRLDEITGIPCSNADCEASRANLQTMLQITEQTFKELCDRLGHAPAGFASLTDIVHDLILSRNSADEQQRQDLWKARNQQLDQKMRQIHKTAQNLAQMNRDLSRTSSILQTEFDTYSVWLDQREACHDIGQPNLQEDSKSLHKVYDHATALSHARRDFETASRAVKRSTRDVFKLARECGIST